MKNIILIMILISLPISVLLQSKQKAPFGGKLIENNVIFVFHRTDGSEISVYNDSGDFYLTKLADDGFQLPVPNFVKREKPIQFVYSSADGSQYATIDYKNWILFESDKIKSKTAIQEDNSLSYNSDFIKISKPPKSPVEDQFHLELFLINNSAITFTISDMLGNNLIVDNYSLNRGLNQIKKDLSKFPAGAYIYSLNAGSSKKSGVFLKIK